MPARRASSSCVKPSLARRSRTMVEKACGLSMTHAPVCPWYHPVIPRSILPLEGVFVPLRRFWRKMPESSSISRFSDPIGRRPVRKGAARDPGPSHAAPRDRLSLDEEYVRPVGLDEVEQGDDLVVGQPLDVDRDHVRLLGEMFLDRIL